MFISANAIVNLADATGSLPLHYIARCGDVNVARLLLDAGNKQESPAIADKPARRESLPKIAPIRRAYNVVADDTGLSSFV